MITTALVSRLSRRRPARGLSSMGSRRGLTLLEVLLAVGVAALIAAGAAYSLNERTADLKAKAAADQLTVVAQAAEAYIKNRWTFVKSKVPNAGDKAVITVADLIAGGYLPSASFNETPYAHHYEIWVRGITNTGDVSKNGFQAMVVTIGTEDPGRTRLPQIALQTRANTGFVIQDPYDNANPDRILGAFGGWTANVPDFRPSGASGLVWLASLLSVQEDITGNDFLYRGQIPGRPDLNEMRTNITMTLDSGIKWKTAAGAETTLSLNGTQDEVQFFNKDNANPVTVRIKKDTAPGDPNTGGSSISINSNLTANTAAAAVKYGANNPYNLYVDGKTNITGNLDVGGDTDVKGNLKVGGNVDLGDQAGDLINVRGIFNVTGPTTLNGDLHVTGISTFDNRATFKNDVTIEGKLTLNGCLAMGGAPDNAGYCLNVGTGGRPQAARFYDDVRIEGALNTTKDVTAENANMRALAYFYQSDRRYKDNIEQLEAGQLEKLLQVQGVSYDWKVDGRADLGVIAQNVEQVFPELVHTDKDGMKSVEYGNFIAPIIEGMRELKGENDALKAKVEELSKQQPATR